MKLPGPRQTWKLPPPAHVSVEIDPGGRGKDVRRLSSLHWWTYPSQEQSFELPPGEIALALFFDTDRRTSTRAVVMIHGTPGAFRELLCDLLAHLMEIE